MRVIDLILDAFYPKRCAACKKLTDNGKALCSDCANKLEWVKTPICITCGNSLSECECDTFIYHFDGIVAPFKNKGVAKELVYSFKFDQDYSLVDDIVENMAKCVKDSYSEINFDFISYVPKKRGEFNQCKVLAKRLSNQLNIPVKHRSLIKVKDSKIQHNLSLTQRFDNVKDTYRAESMIKGQTVLLLDDIKTTGATLNECARELKFSGAEKVYSVTALIR